MHQKCFTAVLHSGIGPTGLQEVIMLLRHLSGASLFIINHSPEYTYIRGVFSHATERYVFTTDCSDITDNKLYHEKHSH